MSHHFYHGWDSELEPLHKQELRTYSSSTGEQIVYEWDEAKDIVYGMPKVVASVDDISDTNYLANKFNKPTVTYYNQLGNDCATMGTTRAVADRLQTMAYLNAEVELFECHPTWQYATYYQKLLGKIGSGGCTLSGMLQTVSEFGVLPLDSPGVESYKNAIGKWNTSKTKFAEVFEKYKNDCAQLKIKVSEIPRSVETVMDICEHGFHIAFGTSIRCSLQGEYWRIGGRWMHAMKLGGFRRTQYGRECQLTNSHGEGRSGWLTETTLDQLMAGRYWDAFVVLDIMRTRRTKPNLSLM